MKRKEEKGRGKIKREAGSKDMETRKSAKV
jgi:hypothetical protein